MTNFVGAEYDLTELVKTHLFIISANNSGSNVLRSVLARSENCWNLKREGQHTKGFVGPTTRDSGTRLIWASRPEWISLFADREQYDWNASRKSWYSQSFSRAPDASIFVTSSPPFLLNVEQITEAFSNSKFLFLVRNPYAVIEGIIRRTGQQIVETGEDIRNLAARHIMACLAQQKENIAQYPDRGLYFSYEKMCSAPSEVAKSIKTLEPALEDLDFGNNIAVKNLYDEPLKNMNAQQITKLTRADVDIINAVFREKQDLLHHFGYEIL